MTGNCVGHVLPGGPDDLQVIPVSGGADSTFLAILLTRLHPDVPFVYLFTDTGAETRELYESLARLEAYLGRTITRIGDKTLYQLVEKYGGFIPSASARYCTRELKLVPMEAYLAQLRGAGVRVHTYVGIRADEPFRSGLLSREDWIETHLPLKDMGIVREDVFRGLAETVGVPRMYRTRSRSGCGCCVFQRRAEVIGFLQETPEAFAQAQAYEKLSESDSARHPDNAVPVHRETGLGLNWLGFPVPARVDARTCDSVGPAVWGKARRGGNVVDLFDTEPYASLWVGVEFFVDPNVGGPGVWFQRLVSWSKSRSGIERQLQNLYEHRLATPEVFHLDVEEMRRNLRFGVYLVQAPAALVDLAGPSSDSYTWQQGASYQQIRHLLGWCTRVLQVAELERQQEENRDAPELSIRREWFESGEKALARVAAERGRLLGMDRFIPSEVTREEEDERFVPCFVCSL